MATVAGLIVAVWRGIAHDKVTPAVVDDLRHLGVLLATERRRAPHERPTRADDGSLAEVIELLRRADQDIARHGRGAATAVLRQMPERVRAWDQQADLTESVHVLAAADSDETRYDRQWRHFQQRFGRSLRRDDS